MNRQAYYRLKASHALFGQAGHALGDAEQARVLAVARHYADIEHAVLGSADAGQVCLTPGAVDDALAEIRLRYDSDQAFATELRHVGLDETALRAALRRDLIIDAVLARVAATAGEVGDTEAEIFYYTHLHRFLQPEARVARHILVTVNEDFPDNTTIRAEQRIYDIARCLALKPARFEEQAMKHSECPTALQGGLLGKVTRGQLYPELEAALFQLPAGALSCVLRSELGFHLLRCDAIEAARPLPYAEVATGLRERLTAERARRATRGWLARLMQGRREGLQRH